MKKPVIIVGSAPVSETLSSANLGGYQKVSLNKSWRLRRDFDHHVFLRSLRSEDRPPEAYPAESIPKPVFNVSLHAAGGLYICSGSVAMIAGYWSVATLFTNVISYFGCDLVFDGDKGGKTHFYGKGDKGPLFGNFAYNGRPWERSIRLMCWGLLHNKMIVNGSGAKGSLLAFPKVPLGVSLNPIWRETRKTPSVRRLISEAGRILSRENEMRTESFDRKQTIFESDPSALNAMHAILDQWKALEPLVRKYCADVEEIYSDALENA